MDATAFTPLLATTDWNEEWQRLQIAREHADDAAIWDEKAKTFPVKHGSQEGYVARFLELACSSVDRCPLTSIVERTPRMRSSESDSISSEAPTGA